MYLEQLYLGCLSQASYIVGDEEAGVAAVIDPRRDVDVYLDLARGHGLEIRHVLLTHFHADFAAGHLELAARTGATIHLGAAAQTEYPSHGLADGDEITLGGVRLRALATPGHTPESTCYLCVGPDNTEPHAVFTGDTLFIGDVGRPDLMASVGASAEELARSMYRSLRGKLMTLPDATIVYPGHGAGSACGKNLSSETWSTIGAQKESNYALQPMDEDRFVQLVASGQPPAPAYFGYAANLNRSQHGLFEGPRGRSFTLAEARRAVQESDAQILDVRDPESFARGHEPNSFYAGLDGRFASWAGAVLDPNKPVIVLADDGRHDEAIVRLARVGFDRASGHVERDTFEPEASVERLDPQELQSELESDAPPLVLDVRGPGEVESGAIEGSLPIPLPELQRRMDEVPRDRPIVAQCAGGYRSMIAASLLRRAGIGNVRDLRGGMDAWRAADMPMTGDAATRCNAGTTSP